MALRKNRNPWVCYEKEVLHSRFCDPACGVSPAERLSPEHLQHLRNAFTSSKTAAQMHENKWNRTSRGENEERGLTLEEFQEVLRSVVGPDMEESLAERFFNEVDVDCSGQVTWKQVCSYLLLEYRERERASTPRAALLDSQPQIKHCSHNKREPTVRVVAVFHPPPLRYVSVSKGGQVTVWNSGLHILKSLGLAGDPAEEVANTRRFRGWVTDAVYMGNARKVAVATDCRDLHFVSVSTARVFEDVHLYGFRSILTALCYWHDVQHPHRSSLLLLGDEKGGVHLLWFLNPSEGFFQNWSKNESIPQRIFFPDLGKHSKLVTYRHIPNVHQEPINRVMFEPDTDVIMTSSESESTSVVFINVKHGNHPYIWKFTQGAKCFDYSASLQLLVTGGCDRTVRLWARFITSRPVATLPGHRAAVLDIAIYEPAGQIFSYSRDAELRVWDISSHDCLKTVSLPFPSHRLGRIPEHGNFPFLLLGPALSELPHLVVGCKDHLAVLSLADKRRGRGGWLTGEEGEPGLSCALYSATLRQVVTGHVDSSVSLWDVESGRRRLQIQNAHGEEKITCMTLDSSHRRLITGARNGTIKVWNILNGLNLHKLEPVTDSEVTGLTCLHGNQLLAVGWSQRIVQYDITAAADLYVSADMSWKSSGVHRSDILAVCECSALGVVATASYDGEVIVWRLDTQGPTLRLHSPTQTGTAPPVDTLLFLQHRATSRKLRNRGVLVSSQGGCLCFWSITGQAQTYGQFSVPEQPSERVLSLSSDQPKNNILVCGDTAGSLHIWDICHFALDIQQEADRPPLLQRWKAHRRAVVSVDVLEAQDSLFVLTASFDGSTGLWTRDGDHVGSFGQKVKWNISEPASYQRTTPKKPPEATEDGAESDDTEPSKVKSHNGLDTRGLTSQDDLCSEASTPRPAERDREQPQQPMYLCVDFSQRVTPHPDRRHLFEDSNHC